MRIDAFTHFMPARFFETLVESGAGDIAKRMRSVRAIYDLDHRRKMVEGFPDYAQILSYPMPPVETLASSPAQLEDYCKIINDGLAEICAKYPGQFPGWVAQTSPAMSDAGVREAERSIKNGALGIQIYTNIGGRPLDEPAFEPLFAAMAQMDRPIWLHPARTAAMPDYAAEQQSRFEMWWCFGWPYDTSVAMARLVFCGLFDRYPNLKIVTHHLGGMIPYFDGRVGAGLQVLGARTSDEDYSRILPSLKRPHLDYFHDFYADTAMFGGGMGALRCGLDFFGADKVVFATDTPLGPIQPAIEGLNRLEISDADRRKIFSGNAEKLIKKEGR